jgi:tRNA-specific 2-thiouridylase
MMGGDRSVMVAMSGGVDSSVAAGLLARQGFNVIGVTLLFSACDDETVNWCCGTPAQVDARAVAQKLGIPFYTVDCATEFESRVLRPAWEEYARGRTPSPCVVCNRQIKFEMLLELGKKLGINKMASGHYARIVRDKKTERPLLYRGKDPTKDQSYFLYSLSEEQLGNMIFPLGELEKTEVREIAREMGFSNAERKESQDACFVYSEGSFAEGLRVRFDAPASSGLVVDNAGNRLGEHAGIHNYTIGQRKGLGIAVGHRAYVTHIDPNRSQVVLSDAAEDLEARYIWATETVWTSGRPAELPVRCQVQIRYRHRPVDAVIEWERAGRVKLRFDTPQRAVAPGQAAVFYLGSQVLGGGWIEKGGNEENSDA